jgi:hypothetical protein
VHRLVQQHNFHLHKSLIEPIGIAEMDWRYKFRSHMCLNRTVV